MPVPVPLLDPPLVPMPVLGEVVVLGDVVALGEVGLVVVEPDMPLPLAPAPAEPERLSCRHFSRSAPVSPTHLLGTSVDAPLAADPVEGLDMEPLVLVEPLVPPADAPPTFEPDVPVAPLAPVEPEDEPEDCAIVTEESARSAAAVAAARVFNIMIGKLLEKDWTSVKTAKPSTQGLCPNAPWQQEGDSTELISSCKRHSASTKA